MRVWFNRTFSSVYAAIGLIREGDAECRFHLIHSNPNQHSPAARVAHEFHVEADAADARPEVFTSPTTPAMVLHG